MNYATKKYTMEEIYDFILNYRTNLIARNRLRQEYIDVIAGGNISQYGLESSMPKASGGTSDPTFQEITRLIKQDKMIDRLEHRVLYIQNRWDRIIERDDETRAIVFNLILSGKSFGYISKTVGMDNRTIKKRLEEVAEILMDE